MKTTLTVSIDLDWPTYEEELSACIKDAILTEVRKEVKALSGELRAEVAKQLRGRQEELVKRALKAMDTM